MEFLRNIYLYIVSFVALMITVVAVITAFNSISDIIIPDSEVYDYGYTTSYPAYSNEEGIEPLVIDEEERINTQKELEVRRAQKSLINSVGAMVVGGATYWFHWSRIEKEHKQSKKDSNALETSDPK